MVISAERERLEEEIREASEAYSIERWGGLHAGGNCLLFLLWMGVGGWAVSWER